MLESEYFYQTNSNHKKPIKPDTSELLNLQLLGTMPNRNCES